MHWLPAEFACKSLKNKPRKRAKSSTSATNPRATPPKAKLRPGREYLWLHDWFGISLSIEARAVLSRVLTSLDSDPKREGD